MYYEPPSRFCRFALKALPQRECDPSLYADGALPFQSLGLGGAHEDMPGRDCHGTVI